MLNSVNVIGRLTAAPELKTTPSGTYVTSFNIAVERNVKSKDGERVTDFFPVVAWRNTAEFINRYFNKGDMIAITGELQSRSYDDKNGNKRKAVEIIAGTVNFCGSKSSVTAEQPAASVPASAPASEQYFKEIPDNDEDLPF